MGVMSLQIYSDYCKTIIGIISQQNFQQLPENVP